MTVASQALRPVLVLVSGKPGAGKSTLARRLTQPDALGLPLLDRDAIKIGLVATHGGETDALRTTLVPRSFDLFYQTITAWLRADVSLIAEHSFRQGRSEADLRPLLHLARAVLVQCDTSPEEAQRRFIARERANPHTRPDLLAATIQRMERGSFDWAQFDVLDLEAPTLRVDTTHGYAPTLEAIIAFCRDNVAGERRGATALASGALPRT